MKTAFKIVLPLKKFEYKFIQNNGRQKGPNLEISNAFFRNTSVPFYDRNRSPHWTGLTGEAIDGEFSKSREKPKYQNQFPQKSPTFFNKKNSKKNNSEVRIPFGDLDFIEEGCEICDFAKSDEDLGTPCTFGSLEYVPEAWMNYNVNIEDLFRAVFGNTAFSFPKSPDHPPTPPARWIKKLEIDL